MTGANINESKNSSSCPKPHITPSILQPSVAQPSYSSPPVNSNSVGEDDFVDLDSNDTGAQSRKPRLLKSKV